MSHIQFFRSGKNVRLMDTSSICVTQKLEPNTYVVKFNPQNGEYYLELIEDFSIPQKIYGDTVKLTDRILNTFNNRSGSVGILLSGTKGSGKTLQAKHISVIARQKHDIPTIIVNEEHSGSEFNTFIQSLSHPCVIIFDEFEKVYDREHQEELLTLLDGVLSSKNIFIFTCNNVFLIDGHMMNRPSRIYYSRNYVSLDEEVILEYCEEKLADKSHIKSICGIAKLFDEFNFDALQCMVEEMNRYNEDPMQVLEFLNIKFTNGSNIYKLEEVIYKGIKIKQRNDEHIDCNPMFYNRKIYIYRNNKEDADLFPITLDNKNLVTCDGNVDIYTYKTEDYSITFKKKVPAAIDYSKFFSA